MSRKKNPELRECKVCFKIKELEDFSDKVYPIKPGTITFAMETKTHICRFCEYDLLHDERIKLQEKFNPKKI